MAIQTGRIPDVTSATKQLGKLGNGNSKAGKEQLTDNGDQTTLCALLFWALLFGGPKGKPLSLSPMHLEKDDHATGLVRFRCPLGAFGLRILSLLAYLGRKALALHDDTLSGLYAGNPQRTTNRPTAEKLLAAFKPIILTAIHHQDSVAYFF